MPTTTAPLTAIDFKRPAILLAGSIDDAMYPRFREQLDAAPETGLVVLELTTLGGDPEVARMMGEDVIFHSEVSPDRRFVFLGKAAVYSAGATLMSFFARQNRYLTRGTRLMIHERRLVRTLNLDGPLSTCIPDVEAALNEIHNAIAMQNEGFENLVRGSRVTMDELLRRAPSSWYIDADEARDLGLVEGLI